LAAGPGSAHHDINWRIRSRPALFTRPAPRRGLEPADQEGEGARHLADRYLDQDRAVVLERLAQGDAEPLGPLGTPTLDAEEFGQLDEVRVSQFRGDVSAVEE